MNKLKLWGFKALKPSCVAVLTISVLGLVSCSKIDDYILGKDNTPQPKKLTPIESKLNITRGFSASVSSKSNTSEYLKLKPVISGQYIYSGDTTGLVQAINKNSGKQAWSVQLKSSLISGPVAYQDVLAFGSANGSLIVINQSTGDKLWQTKLSSQLLAPPAIAKGVVIAKTIDGKVSAFDLRDGKRRWEVAHGTPGLMLKASSSPIIYGNTVLVGYADGKLDGIDITTGLTSFERSIAYSTGTSDVERLVDIDADPIVSGNLVYLASYQGYVGAFSLSEGQFVWRKPASIYKDMLLEGASLYFTDSSDVVWSLNAQTGHVNWKQAELKARGLTEPAKVAGLIVVADKTGYLHFLNPETGEQADRIHLAAGVVSAPIIQAHKMYVLTNNGLLQQFSVS